MKKRNNFFTTLLTVLALHGTCSNAFADDAAATDIAITPYRPSVSNSAQLPAEGQLELEMGMASARTDAARNQSLPYLLKLAFSKEWGVLLGGVAHVINDDGAGQRDQGFGDTTLVIKRAFLISDDTALGLELGNKFPTARQPLGTGQSDWSMNGIVSQDMGNIHVDVNLNASHLGAADQGTSHWQSGLSSSVSTALTDKWSLTAEWAGWRQAGTKNQGQALLALSYSPNKRMTLDAGMTKGLTSATQDWSWFAGIVIPVAKLW